MAKIFVLLLGACGWEEEPDVPSTLCHQILLRNTNSLMSLGSIWMMLGSYGSPVRDAASPVSSFWHLWGIHRAGLEVFRLSHVPP